jgi:hypothetical protein
MNLIHTFLNDIKQGGTRLFYPNENYRISHYNWLARRANRYALFFAHAPVVGLVAGLYHQYHLDNQIEYGPKLEPGFKARMLQMRSTRIRWDWEKVNEEAIDFARAGLIGSVATIVTAIALTLLGLISSNIGIPLILAGGVCGAIQAYLRYQYIENLEQVNKNTCPIQ